ncbi:MAG TPA: S8 family serine peptidase [Polyangiaceae bacterium]
MRWAGCCLFALFGCSEGSPPAPLESSPALARTAPAASQRSSPAILPSAPAFQEGEIIVKYRSHGSRAVTEDVEQWLAERRSFAGATADRSASLDRLHEGIGARRARAFLPGRRGLSTATAQRLFAQRDANTPARRSSAAGPARSVADLANVYVLELPADVDVAAAVRRAAQDPHVEYAQPNYVARADLTPDDTYFASSGSWGQPYADSWTLERINASTAWDVEQGEGVVVGVIDSGLDLAHPDIGENVWENPGEVPDNGVDDDSNGFVDDVSGWNFNTQTPNPTDEYGHGTHVSGIIAAVGDNSEGVIGVAPKARILPVRALGANGFGSMSSLTQGMVYAASLGARVLNNSWGCFAPCPRNPIAEDAVAVVRALGATVVFAAGNIGLDVTEFSPQNRPDVIVVAASDPDDARAEFSNFGCVDVAAPGSGRFQGPPDAAPYRAILSLKSAICSETLCPPELVVGSSYLRQAGTSMAAPHVSGIAALILAQHPEYEQEQLRQVLRHSAFDSGAPGFDRDGGYGRVDAAAALGESPPLSALIGGPFGTLDTAGNVAVTGSAEGPGFANYRLEVGAGDNPANFVLLASSTTPVSSGTLGAWDTNSFVDGPYTLRLEATTASGAVYEDRQPVTLERVFISEPSPREEWFSHALFYRAGERIAVSGMAAAGLFEDYELTVLNAEGTPLAGAEISLPNGGSSPVVNGLLGTWNTSGVPTGAYEIVLTVHTSDGGSDSDSVPVVVDPTLHEGWPLHLTELEPEGYFGVLEGLTAADLDGDGAAELVTVRGRHVSAFTHTGEDLPGWPQSIDPFGYGMMADKPPAVADVTGDGEPDVVVANLAGELFVWEARGELVAGPVAAGARYVAVDDMDGDGLNDIVTSGMNGSVAIWRFESGELVPWFEQLLGEPYQYLSPPALGDVDRDGSLEIAVAAFDEYASYGVADLFLLGAGGVLPGWPHLLAEGAGAVSFTYAFPSLGDIDGDGKLEVVMSDNAGAVSIFRADGRMLAGWPQRTTETCANSATVGDFDGDGRLDVIAGTCWIEVPDEAYGRTEAYLYAWRGNGELFEGFPRGYDHPAEGGLNFGFGAAALADIDGDGEVEALSSSEGRIDPYRSLSAVNADGTTVPGFPKFTAAYTLFSANTSATADFDGDGEFELAHMDAAGLIYLWDLDSPASGPRPWPMYQHDAQHTARADAPAGSEDGVRVRARGDDGSASDGRIRARVRLLNDTDRDIPLRELSIRYWYTDETAPSPQVFELDSAKNEANGHAIPAIRVVSSFGRTHRPRADRYLELGFARQAGKLNAGAGIALDFSIRARNHHDYRERGDYSYRRSRREIDWNRVTAYRNGELIWGVEP